jgi:imidazolonepropionase-like amidohydrolase
MQLMNLNKETMFGFGKKTKKYEDINAEEFKALRDKEGAVVLDVRSPAEVSEGVATSVAAEALGRSDLGVVAPGKAADLLAVRGNPLQDIRDITNTRLVVARGQVIQA